MFNPNPPLFNIDSALSPLALSEVTAEIIEARVSMLAFKNLDFIKKRLHFVLELCTHQPSFWQQLSVACSEAYFLKHEREWVLVFPGTMECGYIRTYRFQPSNAAISPEQYCENVRKVKGAETLYQAIDTQAARYVFDGWHTTKTKATELPTEFVTGRLLRIQALSEP